MREPTVHSSTHPVPLSQEMNCFKYNAITNKLFIISVVIHEKSGYLLCQAHIINAVECNNYWHKFSPLVNDKYALCVDLSKYQSL